MLQPRFVRWSCNPDNAGSIFGQVDIFLILFYSISTQNVLFTNILQTFLIFFIKSYCCILLTLFNADLQGCLNIACANLLYVKYGLFSYNIVHDNTAFSSLCKIQLTTKCNRYSFLFKHNLFRKEHSTRIASLGKTHDFKPNQNNYQTIECFQILQMNTMQSVISDFSEKCICF